MTENGILKLNLGSDAPRDVMLPLGSQVVIETFRTGNEGEHELQLELTARLYDVEKTDDRVRIAMELDSRFHCNLPLQGTFREHGIEVAAPESRRGVNIYPCLMEDRRKAVKYIRKTLDNRRLEVSMTFRADAWIERNRK